MAIEKIKHIIIPILKKYGINRAGIFGRNTNSEKSDVDILVELKPEFSLFDFVRIKLELEDVLHKKVDLVEYKSLKPRLKERILAEEIRIYG